MDQRLFKGLMDSKQLVGKEVLTSLQELSREYPYFQSAHFLLAKAYHDQEHVRYDKQLKIAALYAGDRKILYDHLHDKTFVSGKFFNQNQEADSPFILDSASTMIDENKRESVAESDAEVHPFIESQNNNTVDLVEMSPEVEQIVAKTSDTSAEIKKEITFSTGYTEAIDIDSESSFPEPEKKLDPREIIKRRLAEILSRSPEENPVDTTASLAPEIPTNVSIATEQKNSESPIKQIQEEIPVAVHFIEKQNEETDHGLALENTEKKEDHFVREDLTAELNKPLDNIEKSELEHALEETLLHSLEQLPVIEKDKSIPTPAVAANVGMDIQPESSNRSFTDWLKLKRTSNFGFTEEVHAYDGPDSIENSEPTKLEQIRSEQFAGIEQNIESTDSKNNEKTAGNSDSSAALIDKFIATEPRIIPSKAEFYSPASQAKKSVAEHEDLVSETLARIYFQQGNHQKARWCYEKLSLLHPEKSSYFAALVREIDEQLLNLNKEDL